VKCIFLQQDMLDMISHELGNHTLLTYIGYLIVKYERDIPRVNNPKFIEMLVI
jgi:hypothetical protein